VVERELATFKKIYAECTKDLWLFFVFFSLNVHFEQFLCLILFGSLVVILNKVPVCGNI
jgi:hypothetical protein